MNSGARDKFMLYLSELSDNNSCAFSIYDNVMFEYQPKIDLSKTDWKRRMNRYLDVNDNDHVIIAHKGTHSIFDTANNNVSHNNSNYTSGFRNSSNTVGNSDERNSTSYLDGSPLKLQTYVDLSVFTSPSNQGSPNIASPVSVSPALKMSDLGISIQQARRFISYINLSSNGNKTEVKPDLWILCDASDISSTIMMGVKHIDSEGSRGVNISRITLCNEQQVLDKVARNSTSTHCYAQYNLIGQQNNDEDGFQGSLAVDLEWNKVSNLMQKPPMDARVVLKASACPGDVRSSVYSFYKELTILKTFICAVTTGNVNWVTDHSDVPLTTIVQDLINEVADMKTQSDLQEDEPSSDMMSMLKSLVFKERHDLDFTDRLWNILIACTAYADLVKSLKMVFDNLSRGVIKPLVHLDNDTTLAKLIRDSYSGMMVVPSLKGVTPIRLLAEIGMEKLKRDYRHALVSTELRTFANLDNLRLAASICKNDGSDNLKKQTLDDQIIELNEYHMVLEMTAMLAMFLNLPHADLSSIADQILKYYQRNDVDPGHLFQFDVPFTSVMSVIENCSPCLWKVRFDQTTKLSVQSTVYCSTTELPFSHVGGKNKGSSSETDNIQQRYLLKRIDSITMF